MPIVYNDHLDQIAFYLFVITVLMSLATFTWQFRKAPGAKPQIYGLVCKSVWLLCLVLANTSPGLQDKILWIKLQHVASILSPYLWFELVVQISAQDRKMPAMVRYCFSGMIGCLWLAILSNSWHGLFWRNIWMDDQTIKGFIGPALMASKVSSYLICTITLILSVRWVLITVGLRRKQALWFTFSGLFSLIGAILNNVPVVQVIAPLPLGFLLAGLFTTWGFYRWQVYNIIPLAQEAVVQNMIDGLLVVDEYGYIADMNPVAKAVLTGLPASVGVKFTELAAAWPALAEVGNPDLTTVGAEREYPDGSRCFRLSVTSLQIRGHWLGKVIVFKDITQQKHEQEKLLEQQKALSILAERERLGRELHDGQGQIWNYLGMELQMITALLSGGRHAEVGIRVGRMAEVIKEMHTDARETIVELKKISSVNYDFITSLQKYLAWYEKNNDIAIELVLPEEPSDSLFSKTGEVQLLRIIQEALTNIRKHAKAQQVRIMIETHDKQATVVVEDDGCGFDMTAIDTEGKSFGLGIMRERAEEAGGCLRIESKPGAGTRVTVQF